MKPKILIIEDDIDLAVSHRDNLSGLYAVSVAHDPESGISAAVEEKPAIIILDLGFPDDVEVGLGIISRLRQNGIFAKIIVTTGFGSTDVGARAVQLGASNFIEKPIRDYHGFTVIIDQALRIGMLEEEVTRLSRENDGTGIGGLIGISKSMQILYSEIRKVAPTDANVLIEGETGTGKELVARALHSLSGRGDKPFIVVNSAAIPATMLEDKLFGHEKGAFTGALSKQKGALEEADSGTVFLDEIGEMPPDIQAKILRFVQFKSFQRLGGNTDINVDVRIIAATNRNLKDEVSNGRFREDLFYRLSVFPLRTPPLKDRRDDIPALVSFFLKKFGAQFGRDVRSVNEGALGMMMRYDWPGNVRELENVLQRAILSSEGETIWPHDLSAIGTPEKGMTLEELSEKQQESWIREAYARNGGDLEKTSQELGLSTRQLQRYNKRYGIERNYYSTGN